MRKERPIEAVKTCERNRTLPLGVLVRFSALLGVLAMMANEAQEKDGCRPFSSDTLHSV